MRFKQPPERAEMKPIKATYPLELVHLHFLTIGSKSYENKNLNVLMVTDDFTKYACEYITLKQTPAVVAKTPWENFLFNYSWPAMILTDQGTSFKSSLISELCELAQVKKLRTTPYRPKTNGQYETF